MYIIYPFSFLKNKDFFKFLKKLDHGPNFPTSPPSHVLIGVNGQRSILRKIYEK